MKKIFSLLALMCYFLQAHSQQVHFEQGLSWQEVINKAKAENKPILLDYFATWCVPCKAMDTVYAEPKVAEYINKNFLAVKVQMDSTGKDNEQVQSWYKDSRMFRKLYQIDAFPSFLIFSSRGAPLDKEVGYYAPADFIQLLENTLDSTKQYYTLLGKYQQHRLDSGFMKFLAHRANALGQVQLAGQVANDYINQLSETDLFKKENIWFMTEFTRHSDERGFSLFRYSAQKVQNVEPKLDKVQLKGLVEHIIYQEQIKPFTASRAGKPDWRRMQMNVRKYGSLGNETLNLYKPGIIFDNYILPEMEKRPEWNRILLLIEKQRAGKGQEFLAISSVAYYLNHQTGNFKNFMAAATFYDRHYHSYLTADQLNELAWAVFETAKKQNDLNKALLWSRQAVKIEPNNGMYMDTYANILYKIGRKQRALDAEKQATVLSPDNKDISKNYEKMTTGKSTWDSL